MRGVCCRVWLLLAVFGIFACSSNEASQTPNDGDAELAEHVAETEDETEAESESEAPPLCLPNTEPRNIPDTPDSTFDLGPYLMHTTKTSVVVMWRTLEETDGKVLFGPGGDLAQKIGRASCRERV